MPTNQQQPKKELSKMKKSEKERMEYDITSSQIGETSVSDMPKKGEQTGRTHENKAGKGY